MRKPWRSLLFIPVLEERFLAKAAERGADAIVLDLEASIAAERKQEARAALPAAVERLAAAGQEVLVRLNMPWRPAFQDLEAAVRPGVSALLLAGSESTAYVEAVDALLDEMEPAQGLALGSIGLVLLIESARGVTQAAELAAASPRVCAMTFGIEDYLADMQAAADNDVLERAGQRIAEAARSVGAEPLVVPASLAELSDLDAFEAAVKRGKALGSSGGFAVHPGQVAVLNQAFAPNEAEVAWARKVIDAAAAAEAEGKGAIRLDGRMIDLPIVKRAEAILARAP
ncbi:MAG: CoA ester lyase [Pseudomonadota bacterium]